MDIENNSISDFGMFSQRKKFVLSVSIPVLIDHCYSLREHIIS